MSSLKNKTRRLAAAITIAAITTALVGGAISAPAFAQNSTKDDVMVALDHYMVGSSYSIPDRIKAAFYEEADMFLSHPEKPIFLVSAERYAGFFQNRDRNVFNGRYAKVLNLDTEGDLATAKIEIVIPEDNKRYIDYFLLKKLDGEWKILSKSAGGVDSQRTGERALLILTDKKKGENFSDLIADYKKAASTGATVDFVSVMGGAVSFHGVDMRNAKHKKYMYNADFLYALENTASAASVSAADYASAHYVRDRDAKKMKSGNAAIDKLYAEICSGENTCGN
ncbi:MAG: nuclear transport factor 2 family protein [Maricaulaceae bacterium]